jgi:XisH protein
VRVGLRRLYVDLAADRDRLGAERDGRRIAVEIQSFLGDSDIENLHHAVGQYVVYRAVLGRTDPDRVLYLAVADEVYNDILSEPLGQTVIDDLGIRIVVFNPNARRILEWRS